MFLLPIRRVSSAGFLKAVLWGVGIGSIICAIIIGFVAIAWTDTVKNDNFKLEMFQVASGKTTSDESLNKTIDILHRSVAEEKTSFVDLKDSITDEKVRNNLQTAFAEWERLEPIIKDAEAIKDLDYHPRDWGDWLILSIKVFLIGLCCLMSLVYWLVSIRFADFNSYDDVNPGQQSSLTYPWGTALGIVLIPFYLPFIVISQPLLFVSRVIGSIIFSIRWVFRKIFPKNLNMPAPKLQTSVSNSKKKQEKREVIAMEQAKKNVKRHQSEFINFFRSRIGTLINEAEEKITELIGMSENIAKRLEENDRKIATGERELERLRRIALIKDKFSDDAIIQEFEKILTIPGVSAMDMSEKHILRIYTAEIKVEDDGILYLIGRLIISFDLSNASIKVMNIDPENGPGNEQHPFAQNRDGSFCFGKINETLRDFFANMDYYALVAATMTAVRSVSGASSTTIKKWRMIGYAKKKKRK